VIQAHQPGSEPIDIPETISQSGCGTQANTNTYSDRTCSQGASSNSGQGSLSGVPTAVTSENSIRGMNKRLPEFGWVPEICAAFQKDNLRRSLCDKSPAQAEQYCLPCRRRIIFGSAEIAAIRASSQRCRS